MARKVVITGMGICAPNGVGLNEFRNALVSGKSGITHHSRLEELGFRCQVGGAPDLSDINLEDYFPRVLLRGLNASGIVYGMIAGQDAWTDAGLTIGDDEVDWDAGIVFGAGLSGADKFRDGVYIIDDNNVRRLGSTTVIQTIVSGCASMLAGRLATGNQVTANSSACATGTEAILMGYDRIMSGQAERMLVGSTCDSSPYVWGGFDAMRVLPDSYNHQPEQASRPMSASAKGFVPGSGAGAFVIESEESALARGANIYAEVLGGAINSGGQRMGGSLTAPNAMGVQRCIRSAIKNTRINPSEIDTINGHLTATVKDPDEIDNWIKGLDIPIAEFPPINSTKGLIGHGLAASGSIECVASVLQITHQEIYGNINCEDIHPSIIDLIGTTPILQKTTPSAVNTVIKASFGFGDVNACIIFRKYE